MAQTPDQLTRRPICPVCKSIQLTDEELAKNADPTKRRCWFCLADQFQMSLQILLAVRLIV